MKLFYFLLFLRLNKRPKRMDRESLLQGTTLPESLSTVREPLPKAKARPSQHLENRHEPMIFEEPENRQGELTKP